MKSIVYTCDACGEQIENPHTVKMKEFYLAWDDVGKQKTKIHLCKECFWGLKSIGKKIADKED